MSGLFIRELGPGYRLTVEDAPAETDVEVLPHALEAYNEGQWPQHPPWRPLAIFVRDEAQIVAGLAGAWLDTFSFQARGFYEKLGYEEFGRLDYPPDHHRHFMQKGLTPRE